MRRRWLVAGGSAAALAAVLFALLSKSPEQRPTVTPSVAAPTPPAPVAPPPTDPRARLEGLRFLERNADGTVAVIDDAVAKRSYFSRVGDPVLTAKVQAITAKEVTLADPTQGVIILPYRGRGDTPMAIQRPFENREVTVPVHIAPSVDPKQVAEDQAIVAEYMKTRPGGGGGGGGGTGGGGGNRKRRDAELGITGAGPHGGRGRQRHLLRKAAEAKAAAEAAKGSGAGSNNNDDD